MTSIYQSWGFRSNPFDTSPLTPDAAGSTLLVGRTGEVRQIQRRLFNPPKLATVEGPNGVGKTSIINVAAYRCLEQFRSGETDQLLIPCKTSFQLAPNPDLAAFARRVHMGVAQALIEWESTITASRPQAKNVTVLDRWMNAPQRKAWQATFRGFGIGGASQPGDTVGFTESGLERAVLGALGEVFPAGEGGGVVCVIDNLELLQTSEAARQLIERLRDTVLNVRGLRWVLCGATGIVLSAANSARFAGLLHAPVEVGSMGTSLAPEVYQSRVNAYKVGDECYLPLEVRHFERLYSVFNKNLRSTLGSADDFCMWISDRAPPDTPEQKESRFSEWFKSQSDEAHEAVSRDVRPRAWEVFDVAITKGGLFSPSDNRDFGCNSPMALRPHVKALEEAGLLQSSIDDTDKRRKTISVLPKGWLVADARRRTPQPRRPRKK